MKQNIYLKFAIGAILLEVLFRFMNFVLGLPAGEGLTIWNFLANFLIAATLGYYILHSNVKGYQLSLFVFILYFLIGHFNILIEAYIFNVTDRAETTLHILEGLLVAITFSPIYVYLFKENTISITLSFTARSILSWTWRIILGNFIYIIFYIIAGLILTTIYPELLQFYEGKMPSIDLIIKTQLLLRGFIFVAVAILIVRTLHLSLLKKALFIGLVFSILGGIAPLIQPNELMPNYVRMGHLFEVGISNFLYGVVLGFLLGQKKE
ncbi:MAG: hypothetical protein OEX22_10485 [Cyclobacteriaceae bacterium]|nr:hypothetical protein [Cyclobacteriaceae bacterium]